MDHGRLLKSLFITPFGGLEMGSWRGIRKALPSRHKSHSPDKNDQNHKKTLSEKQVTCQIWNQQSFIPRTSRSRGTMVIVKSPKMSDKAELRCCVNTPPRMRSLAGEYCLLCRFRKCCSAKKRKITLFYTLGVTFVTPPYTSVSINWIQF